MEASSQDAAEAAEVYALMRAELPAPLAPNAPSYSVEHRGHDTPCFIWGGAKNRRGYGRMIVRGKDRLVHALAFEKVHGRRVRPGFVPDHLCRVHECFRPGHLEEVTQAENVRRGRSTKLTPEQVDEIRASGLSHYQIACDYGVSRSQVWLIKTGKRWTREEE